MIRQLVLITDVRLSGLIAFLCVTASSTMSPSPGAYAGDARLTPAVIVAQAADQPSTNAFSYLGPGKCSLCHTRKEKVSEFLSTAFCALDEYSIWDEQDVHRKSFDLMTGELGRQMAVRLGWQPDELPQKEECLSCHVGLSRRQSHLRDAEIPEPDPRFLKAGVSCEACHGPSSKWINDHWKDTTWRTLAPSVKASEFGYSNVRGAVAKSTLCFSCHIGDPKQNRIVTHAMYAAGHPPLPGIEITTFEDSMPAHWRTVREKPAFEHRTEFLKVSLSAVPEGYQSELPRFRSTLIGGLVGYRQSLSMIAAEAERVVSDEKSGRAWPELSVFDCQACHHELRSPSFRIAQGYGQRIPGRPAPFQWPSALLDLSLRQMAESSDLKAGLESSQQRLVDALNRQPFGNPVDLIRIIGPSEDPGADTIVNWIDRCVGRLESTSFDRGRAIDALRFLLDLGPEAYPDYHSARQIAWAVQTLIIELELPYPVLVSSENAQSDTTGSSLLEDLEIWRKFRDQRLQLRRESNGDWRDLLVLDLPTTGDGSSLIPRLGPDLQAAGQYDPRSFQQTLESLRIRYEKRLAESGTP